MKRVMRLLMTATVAGGLSFFVATTPGCSPDEGTDGGDKVAKCDKPTNAECACKKNADCHEPGEKGKWVCLTAIGECSKLCKTNNDCPGTEICEDAQCMAPGCGSDAECTDGKHCLAGVCAAPVAKDAVASCVVLPRQVALHEGAETTFTVLAKNAEGKTVPFKGDVTWTATGASIDGTSVTATATGGVAETSVSVKATVNGKDCDEATGFNYPAVAAGSLRVVVASLGDKKPVEGATVVIRDETKTTGENGAVTVTQAAGATISVFHNDYAYVTLVDAPATDVIVYLDKVQQTARFTGEMGARQFDRLSDRGQTVHLALHGGSIPGNLVDVQLAALLGEMVDTELDFGGKVEVGLPEGTIIGIGDNMFRKDFSVQALPGYRTVWGIAGNADMNKVTASLGGALGGGSGGIEVGSILSAVLPLLNKFQSGAVTGLDAKAGETKALGTVNYDTLLRLKVDAKFNDLPTYKVAGEDARYSGAIVIGGAHYGSQGLVPLGISVGIDGDPKATDPAKKPDGKIDPVDAGGTAGTVALRVAPRHSGLENADYVLLALAADVSSLMGGGDKELVLSGRVKFPGDLKFEGVNTVQFEDFLTVPENPTLDGRTFKRDTAVAGADVYRLDLGTEKKWSVYFPTDKAEVTLPDVPTGFDDRLTKPEGGKLPQAILQSISLKGGAEPINYEAVVKFNGSNMDDLTRQIDAFSTREVKR